MYKLLAKLYHVHFPLELKNYSYSYFSVFRLIFIALLMHFSLDSHNTYQNLEILGCSVSYYQCSRKTKEINKIRYS